MVLWVACDNPCVGALSRSIWIWLEPTVAPAVGDVSTGTDSLGTPFVVGIHGVNAALLLPGWLWTPGSALPTWHGWGMLLRGEMN